MTAAKTDNGNRANVPDLEECRKILADYGTPEHVIRHCEAVAHCALVIGRALNARGYHLDLDLVQAAGLLHDVARVEQDHQKAGASLLARLGYPDVASIISVHMTYPAFHAVDAFDETDLVCLGDRLCKFDEYVGLEERMNYILEKFKGNEEAHRTILANKRKVAVTMQELRERIGMSVDELMAQHPISEEGWH